MEIKNENGNWTVNLAQDKYLRQNSVFMKNVVVIHKNCPKYLEDAPTYIRIDHCFLCMSPIPDELLFIRDLMEL